MGWIRTSDEDVAGVAPLPGRSVTTAARTLEIVDADARGEILIRVLQLHDMPRRSSRESVSGAHTTGAYPGERRNRYHAHAVCGRSESGAARAVAGQKFSRDTS